MPDRRRKPRVKFRHPIQGSVGETRVAVLDASPVGLGIAHQEPLPARGGVCRVTLHSPLGPIALDCAIVRTVARLKYLLSGLEVLAADRQSVARLETMAEENS